MSEEVMVTHQAVMTKTEVVTMSSGLTTGGGFMLYLSNNATAIGAIVAICSLIATVIFMFLNYRATLRGQQINRRNIEDIVIKDLKSKARSEAQKKMIDDLLDGR